MGHKRTDKIPSKAMKQAGSKTRSTARDRLNELVNLVVATAELKGWYATIDAKDDKTFRYATVSVERTSVTGTFEIICDERVKVSYHRTSFHSYGLADLYDAIGNEFSKLSWIEKKDSRPAQKEMADVALLDRVLRRFHEYDVQDLFHAVLRGLFDDVRPEEYTPSYVGGSSRMDFLLKSQQIVIEIKLASATLRDKQIGEQLLIDIGRYQSHPDCRRLICFVYDPLGYVRNPAGLEADLSRALDKQEVKVVIVST